jgi:Creatinase/Prolidase N-terminal domain
MRKRLRQEVAMTVTNPTVPPEFTNDDFAARMRRVVSAAVENDLAGVIVTPGPDLVWLTGYRPTAITERLTMLVLTPDNEPTLLVPILERPDAEAAEGAGSVSLVDWEDGTDPYEVAGPLLRTVGEYGISDSAWAMHLLGLQGALPQSRYRSLTACLPMMRAIKDDNELIRLAAAGQRQTPPTKRSCGGVSLGGARPTSALILLICCESSDTSKSTSPSSGLDPMVPIHITRQGLG